MRDMLFVGEYIKKIMSIEEIKKRTPIWKKEHYKNEESEWLKGVSLTQ